MNAMHFPAGFILFIISYLLLPNYKHKVHILLVLSSLIFGAIELIQPYVGRTASWNDLITSVLGVLLAWLWVLGKNNSLKLTNVIIVPLVVGGMLWLFQPGVEATWRAYKIHQLFPVLANFESNDHDIIVQLSRNEISRHLYDGSNPSGGHYLRFTNQDQRWTGFELRIIKQNWTNYSALCFDAMGALPLTKLYIRFDDQLSSNSQTSNTQSIDINTQWNGYCVNIQHIKTPNKRIVDLAHMKKLVFFLDGNRAPKHFSLDNIRVN